MKNIIFCGYRNWAYTLLSHAIAHSKKRGDVIISDVLFTGAPPACISPKSNIKTHFFDSKKKFSYEKVVKFSEKPLIVFAGWSWLVPSEITKRYCCVCFHPSDLPFFAGGSPIQNQVLSGVSESMLTVFKMDEGIDTGPTYKKTPISLLGPIEEVFDKIALAGLPIIRSLISDFANDELNFTPQLNLKKASSNHMRRTPHDSIFSLEVISSWSFSKLQIAIDVLSDPYPNLKITLGDILIVVKSAFKIKTRPNDLNELTIGKFVRPQNATPVYLKVADGFAVIVDYLVEDVT